MQIASTLKLKTVSLIGAIALLASSGTSCRPRGMQANAGLKDLFRERCKYSLKQKNSISPELSGTVEWAYDSRGTGPGFDYTAYFPNNGDFGTGLRFNNQPSFCNRSHDDCRLAPDAWKRADRVTFKLTSRKKNDKNVPWFLSYTVTALERSTDRYNMEAILPDFSIAQRLPDGQYNYYKATAATRDIENCENISRAPFADP